MGQVVFLQNVPSLDAMLLFLTAFSYNIWLMRNTRMEQIIGKSIWIGIASRWRIKIRISNGVHKRAVIIWRKKQFTLSKTQSIANVATHSVSLVNMKITYQLLAPWSVSGRKRRAVIVKTSRGLKRIPSLAQSVRVWSKRIRAVCTWHVRSANLAFVGYVSLNGPSTIVEQVDIMRVISTTISRSLTKNSRSRRR